jgi:sterol desaturase/sphingolipid hydroxylase (fatty acid hydroxylase superfamily)
MPNFAITPMVLVIPVLFAMIFLELLVSYLKGMKVYRLQDTVTSVNTGLLSQFVNSTGAIISVFMYGTIEQKFGAFEWNVQNPSTWIFSLLLYDFLYYWVHRTGHEVNIFWAAHITHHSSEEFNISTAMRQASTGFYFKWVFYIPLAVLGIPLQVFIVVGLVDLLYQVWVHTQIVGKLGWLEKFLVTPSNHRVHHGQNDYCIDKNYGGTFAIEREEEPIVYGIRKPLNSWNPVWGNLHYYYLIIKSVKRQDSFSKKLMCVFGEPAWQGEGAQSQKSESPSVDTYKKFSTSPPVWVNLSGLLTTLISASLLIFFLGTKGQMSIFIQTLWVAIAILTVFSAGVVWSSAGWYKSE